MAQSMQFTDKDVGPCYLSDEDKQKRKLDIHLGKTREQDLNKSSLVESLKNAGIQNPTGHKKDLQKQAV